MLDQVAHEDLLLDDPWFERTGPLAAPVIQRELAREEPRYRRPTCERVAMAPLARPH